MKRGQRCVLFVGMAILLIFVVAPSEGATTTIKSTAVKTTAAKFKTAQPATAQPKTVLDYFMLLPGTFFDDPNATRARRKSWLYGETGEGSIVDIKNDYLKMAGDAAQHSIYMALFRYKGRVLVGIYSDGEGGGMLFLMRYENGKWSDVMKSMLPVPYSDKFVYVIPRYGTTIKVTRANTDKDWERGTDKVYGKGPRAYDLVWTNGKFKVRRV